MSSARQGARRPRSRIAIASAVAVGLMVMTGGPGRPSADRADAESLVTSTAYLPGLSPPAGPGVPPRPTPAPPDPLDAFFSLASIHQIEIEVGDDGFASLLERPRDYVPGTVRIDGTPYPDVGVRLKGGAGSFVALDGDYPPVSGDGNGRPGKSAFIVDFNRYVKDSDLHGLEKLTLNNLVQDPSGIHEFLGYTLFRAVGVPASRSGFASVFLNGREKGLYALIETPDNDEFLQRWFDDDAGNLYEGQYGADLRAEAIGSFDQDNGRDTTRRDLCELVAALDALAAREDPLPVLEAHLDMDRYLRFAATELVLGHWDGYAWSANNYMIHHDVRRDRWTFVPWGIDQLFEDPLGEFAGVMRGPAPEWGAGPGGRVHALCMASRPCRHRLFDAFAAVVGRIERLDLAAVAGEARRVVEPLLLAEAREFGDPEVTLRSHRHVLEYLTEHRAAVASWLPCLIDQAVDHDGDGYDGCTVDCRDHERTVHPGAAETCNLRDDDCNGRIDDPAECPRCLEIDAPDGESYALCFDDRPWLEAGDECRSRGARLASIHDAETFHFLALTFLERLERGESWIGLHDREEEGRFEWVDRSAVDFLPWRSGAPRRHGEESDCVLMHEGGWADAECEAPQPYVCKW